MIRASTDLRTEKPLSSWGSELLVNRGLILLQVPHTRRNRIDGTQNIGKRLSGKDVQRRSSSTRRYLNIMDESSCICYCLQMTITSKADNDIEITSLSLRRSVLQGRRLSPRLSAARLFWNQAFRQLVGRKECLPSVIAKVVEYVDRNRRAFRWPMDDLPNLVIWCPRASAQT